MDLDDLSTDERATVFLELISEHPRLRERAEVLARDLIASVTSDDIAAEVQEALDIDHTRIGELEGRGPGGYVEPAEAAVWLLEDAVKPFEQDIVRLGRMALFDDARVRAAGLLDGLHQSVDNAVDGTVLSWCPEFPAEHAEYLERRFGEMGIQATA